ncbi:MAG: hypothetical protein B7Z15_22300 [Rhizobiales bacterium 32-66-8]|nr:MAG: hypothetical protein B7Z15_22300 [Rhizobiales bacterium 32-66-8]
MQAGRGTVLRAATFEDWLVSTQARRGKTGFRAFETDLVDGRWLWMTETVDADGWMLCIASDITTLRADERAVRQDRDIAMKAAHTDDLTGVANRRFITARIEEMLQSPRPSSASGSGHGCVAVIDIDNFKYINDQHGHAVGDAILKDFARRMLTLVRRADCFGRIGGEEFLLVMPGIAPRQATVMVEAMLDHIRTSQPLPTLPQLRYTFSAGIACGQPGDTASALCVRADQALYDAKLSGRDRVHVEALPPVAASG